MADSLFYKIINNSNKKISPYIAKISPETFSKRLKNPVFLIGSARSGTTILANLLGMHKDVANWSEANEIFDPDWYPWRPQVGNTPPMEYDPVAFTNRWWQSARHRKKDITGIFGAYQWLHRKTIFLNNSPFNTYRIPYLLDIFPEAKFIHIIRDGRAVIYSYASRLVKKNKLREWPEPQKSLFEKSFEEFAIWLANYWKICIDEIEKKEKQLELREKGIFFEVTYEYLCANKSETINDICQFIGLNSSRFRSSYYTENIVSQNSKWQEKLKPETIVKITQAMQPVLQKRGYK